MRIKYHGGSCILFILMISFVLSVIGLRCWQIASLLCDVEYQRELFYKRFYLAERVFNMGVESVCKNFDNFLNSKRFVDINVGACLTEEEIRQYFTVYFKVANFKTDKFQKKSDCLLISAGLLNKCEIVCNLRCVLERKVADQASKSLNQNGYYFVINNFTLSSSL
jgi:hypothetical protein